MLKFTIERVLQDNDCCRLIDDRTSFRAFPPLFAEHPLRGHCREPFVYET